MDRSETISRITAKLASLDVAAVHAVADFVEDVAASNDLPRPLTERELALIEQSKTDFRAGRTLSIDEARAYIDAGLARRREQCSKS